MESKVSTKGRSHSSVRPTISGPFSLELLNPIGQVLYSLPEQPLQEGNAYLYPLAIPSTGVYF